MPITYSEISKKSNGGTELQTRDLERLVDPKLLEKVQIIPSRVRELSDSLHRILYLHDLPNDPESEKILKNEGWRNFHKIVFVSYWQRDFYCMTYGIPFSKTRVIRNSIEPFPVHTKPKDIINLVYFTTPHRGLELLCNVFPHIRKKYPNVNLKVISSFDIYGWKDRNKDFVPLYNTLSEMDGVTYSPSIPYNDMREVLKDCHIFAYPSVWLESSCRCLIESMSAGLVCVHPDLAALTETSGNLTFMYNMHEDHNMHMNIFFANLCSAIDQYNTEVMQDRLKIQKTYIDSFHNLDYYKIEWENLINEVINTELVLKTKENTLIYNYTG